ncbi:MAG: RNA-binding transcriptional accessory protein [Clostridiaceae bacterium]|nr:RNA-binding transcriptional accessory protein [Clostridiaceae bacterium]
MQEIKKLSEEFSIQTKNAEQIIHLLEEGNTVPFIARYRKNLTGNLDDQSLRLFAKEWQRLKSLSERKSDILRILKEAKNLTPDLEKQITQAENLTVLEDLYRPYRPKKQTRATKAIEQGLEPLANLFLTKDITEEKLQIEAEKILPQIPDRADVEDVLNGAADILADRMADRADVRRGLRNLLQKQILVHTQNKNDQDSVYRMYYDFQEKLSELEPHRFLAIQRGEKEGYLKIDLLTPDELIVNSLAKFFIPHQSKIYSRLYLICEDSWNRLLAPSLKNELWKTKKEEAEERSIELFSANLKNLLLQAPIHDKYILGWDPGYTHGCKLAIINDHGVLIDTEVIFPFESKQDSLLAEQNLFAMLSEHPVDLIAIGNGTASRESELWVADFIEQKKLKTTWLIVSEAGASVYSASPTAAQEFPDLDVNLRSAVSIARRVQDPLAELVKIDPQAIGVGQYQHDINANKLESALSAVVEDCVNQVGVDLNTASPHILSYVSGLNKRIADEIIKKRQDLSGFTSREQLKDVKYLGDKTFEQAAGFLRIADAPLYLDRTAVHPESYQITEQIAKYYNIPISQELGSKLAEEDISFLQKQFKTDPFTLTEIKESLLKPNRDPRDDFDKPILKDKILKNSDLKAGMILSGTVRNVVDFGAFVDVGIEHDGLIHISKMSDKFVKDPLKILQVGDQVSVEILSYDIDKQRLQLRLVKKKEN